MIAIGVAVVALTALASGLSVLERRIALRLTKRITRELRESMLDKIYRLSRQHYDTTPMPELHDRLVTHADRVDFATTILLRDVVPGAVLAFAMLSLLFVRSPLLTGVTVVVGGLSLIVNRVSDKTLEKRFESYHGAFETYSAGVISSLRAQDLHAGSRRRVVRARSTLTRRVRGRALWHPAVARAGDPRCRAPDDHRDGGCGDPHRRRSCHDRRFDDHWHRAVLLRGLCAPARTPDGNERRVPNLIEGQASLAKIHELLDRTDERPYSGTTRLEVVGALSMRNVTFGYGSGPPVLQSFSLELQPHCVTALVGPNGSGKSSVVNLVLGHYRPTIGEVCIDGLRYDDADLAHVLRHIGIVPQDPFFFGASIRENLIYGSTTISADDIRWAIGMAGAQSIVDALPLGLDTVLGEDARSLSGGQRQRIAIARALVRRPKILILDEPTNHLDRNGIAEVLANLRSWADRPAVLIVSHHSEAVDMADHVVNLGAAAPASR